MGFYRVAVDGETWAQSCVPVWWLHPSTHPCWETLPANSSSIDWDGWGASWVLNGVCDRKGTPVPCPHKSLLAPGFPLSPSGSREAWAKLLALSLPSSVSPCCYSVPKFPWIPHIARFIGNSNPHVHVVGFWVERTRFFISDLTVNFHRSFLEYCFVMKCWLT
jgi:hypothetical protein